MESLIVCSNCRHQLRVPSTLINNWVKCPDCQFTFVAEAAESDPTVAKAEDVSNTWSQRKEALMRDLLPSPTAQADKRRGLSIDPDPRPSKSGPMVPMPVVLGVGVLAFGLAFAGGYILVKGGISFGGGGGWQELESKEGMFRIQMPGRAKEQTQKVPTPIGTVKVVIYSYGNDPAYMVGYADYPAVILQAPPDRLIDFALQGAIAGLRNTPGAEAAQKLDERPLNYKGFFGREFEVEIPGKGRAMARAYLVKHRIYILVVGGGGIRHDSEESKKFLESFELTAIPDKPVEPEKNSGPQWGLFPNVQGPVNPVGPAKPGRPQFKKSGSGLKGR